MKTAEQNPNRSLYVAFIGQHKFADGEKGPLALAIHAHLERKDSRDVQVFDLGSGQEIYLDTSGSEADVRARYDTDTSTEPEHSSKSPLSGRSRMSVAVKEVALLPRHWQWLESQPSGASAALRRLVDRARKDSAPQDRARLSQNRTHRFLSSMAGNLPGFEEAIRALFAADEVAFHSQIANWPNDIVAVATDIGRDAFSAGD